MKKFLLTIGLISSTLSFGQAVTSGLIEYFNFNQNIEGKNGTTDNTIAVTSAGYTTDHLGNPRSALKSGFEQVNLVTTMAGIPSTTGELTISFWLRITTEPQSCMVRLGKGKGMNISYSNKQLMLIGKSLVNDTIKIDYSKNGALNSDWTHVVLTYNGKDNAQFYINKVPVTANKANFSFSIKSNEFGMGDDASGTQLPGQFELNELYIFGRVINSTEMSQLFNYENSTARLSKNNVESVQLYPNPSSGTVQLNALQPNDKIAVTDINGVLVHEKVSNGTTSILELNELTNGMYFINIQRSGEIITTEKLMLTHH